jgi:hypothetical protein
MPSGCSPLNHPHVWCLVCVRVGRDLELIARPGNCTTPNRRLSLTQLGSMLRLDAFAVCVDAQRQFGAIQ